MERRLICIISRQAILLEQKLKREDAFVSFRVDDAGSKEFIKKLHGVNRKK